MDNKTRYFVNGDPQETSEAKLTVRDILKDADFIPPEDYDLTRVEGNKTFADLDKEVPIEKDEKFLAVFKGTTPMS